MGVRFRNTTLDHPDIVHINTCLSLVVIFCKPIRIPLTIRPVPPSLRNMGVGGRFVDKINQLTQMVALFQALDTGQFRYSFSSNSAVFIQRIRHRNYEKAVIRSNCTIRNIHATVKNPPHCILYRT